MGTSRVRGRSPERQSMRIPFPKTIPLGPLLAVLTVVLVIQMIQGTDPAFALLMLAAQLTSVMAFNRMGGMTHMAGAFCVFAVLPNVTVPEITHMLLGQPGDYNLRHPLVTAGTCAVFFTCIMASAFMVSSMSHPVPLFDKIHFSIVELRIVSALSCVVAVGVTIKIMTLPGQLQDGTILAALYHFVPALFAAAVMLATYVRIVTTNGKSAMNWYVALLLLLSILPGLLNASKEGMLTPLVCWIMVTASSRHRFTWFGTLGLATVLFVAWGFVYPFSQNARSEVRDAQLLSDKAAFVIQFIRDPSSFSDYTATFGESNEFGTATAKVNIVQRYSQLLNDDMLIDSDLRSGYTSIERYAPVLFSVVPHALWPDRPQYILSNELGHKAQITTNDEDTGTGISIGSPAMFFDLGGWLALIVYTLLGFTLFFFIITRLVGSSEKSIWGLVPIGGEVLLAGVCSPSSMFLLVIYVASSLLGMIVILKVIGYIATTLISRPIPASRIAAWRNAEDR